MKAIFMREFAGRLMEVERRDIEPRMDFYRAIIPPLEVQTVTDPNITQSAEPKKEHWVCHSRPVNFNDQKDFAVFLLKGIE